MFNSKSFDDTLESFTFGYSQNIDHLILLNNWVNSNFFFEKSESEVNFISGRSSINLDFTNVIFLLS